MVNRSLRGLLRPLFIVAVSALIHLLTITPSFSDIYQYVDEKGIIHFTNTPRGSNYEKIISEGTGKVEHKTTNNITTGSPNYEEIILEKSRKYNLDPSLIRAVITAESNWQPRAVSSKGAMGLMQLIPSTARDMDVMNPFDPEENIEGGTRYLRYLLDMFDGDLNLALAAYNAGPETVRKFSGIPPITETRDYVKRVLSMYKGKTGVITQNPSIYKVVLEDGSVLFTNTPSFYKKYYPSKL